MSARLPHPVWCDPAACRADLENHPGQRITPEFFWQGHHFSAPMTVEPQRPTEVHIEVKLWNIAASDPRDTDTPPELMLIFTRTDGPKSVESYDLTADQIDALQRVLATFRATMGGAA